MVNIIDGIRRMAKIMSGGEPNPTEVTAEQLGTYSKEEFNAKVDNLISSVDMRLSQYGDTSFIPVNVSGSFEGSASGYRAAAIFREHDGRVYLLRNGSDGRTDGAYYAEVELSVDGISTEVSTTSIPYHPPFIPEGWHVTEVAGGYKDQVYGRIQNEAGAYKTFIAYTNYTMNQDLHTGIIIEKYPYIIDIFIWEEGGTVFISQLDTSNGMGFVIRKVYTNNLSADPVLITGWSGTGIDSKQWTDQGFIRLSDIMQRDVTDTVNNAYAVSFSGVNGFGVTQTWPQVEIYHLGGARFRAIFGHESWVNHVGNTSDRKFFVRQVDFNVYLATYELTQGYRSPIIASLNDAGAVQLTATDKSRMDRRQFDGGWDGNVASWVISNPDGLYMVYHRLQANDVNMYVEYGRDHDTFMDLNLRDGSQKAPGINVPHVFGTAMHAPLFTPNVASNDSMTVTNHQSEMMRSNMGGWIPTDDFRLPNGTVMKSTPLNSDRETMVAEHWPCEQVVEIVNDEVFIHRAIFWPDRYEGRAVCSGITDPGTVPVLISEEILVEVQNRALAIANANGYVNSQFNTYIVVTQHSVLPPFATTFFHLKDKAIMQVRQTLDFGGQKTGQLPMPTTTASVWEMCRTGATGIWMGGRAGFHGIHIADYNDFSVQGGCGIMGANWVGNSGGIGSFWKFKDNQWTITYRETSQTHVTNVAYPIPIPKVGVVMFGTGIDYTVYNCNLSGIIIGKNETDVTDMENRRFNTASIFFTTAVVNGWVVYFTEETLVTIGNVQGFTSPQNIDLQDLFPEPANKKLLVYVRLNDGKFDHVIVEDPIIDDNHLFIGYVYTNNDGIRTIEVDKVLGINGYALSGVKRGQAIAVTDGNPNGEGSFHWK
ncbi:hypothetical protein SPLA10_PHROGS00060 [Salmonella phage SPLA10]|nr:hypothetical protein SPLA10_PHROGS00060 [Salmonella phage SPLA10]